MNTVPIPISQVGELEFLWNFAPSPRASLVHGGRRLSGLVRMKRRPQYKVIKELTARGTWLVYFVYLPGGQLAPHHRFSLQRFRNSDLPLFVVCSTPSPALIPLELQAFCDSLYWKALPGYDFSAYTLALEAIADHSPGANTLVVNDSMFGPFTNLRPFVEHSPWDLTGFTASGLGENHIQSYAFSLKRVDSERLAALRSVFFRHIAFSHVDPVISLQELRLARVAAKRMSVGAFWYADGKCIDDACLRKPFELLDAGFPFLKRSLLGKMSHFQNRDVVEAFLKASAHPL